MCLCLNGLSSWEWTWEITTFSIEFEENRGGRPMAIVVNPENVATAASADSHASQAHKNIPSRQSGIFQQQGCLSVYKCLRTKDNLTYFCMLSVNLRMTTHYRKSSTIYIVVCGWQPRKPWHNPAMDWRSLLSKEQVQQLYSIAQL